MRAAPGTSQGCEVGAVAIPTCGRGGAALRALGALDREMGAGSPKVLIADDSRPRPESQGLRRVLLGVARRRDLPVRYIGPEERSAVFTALMSRGFPPHVAACAVGGTYDHNVGTNRNCLLLHSAGMLLLSMDDDMLPEPRVWSGPDASGQDAPSSAETWFFPDRRSAVARTAVTGRYLLPECSAAFSRARQAEPSARIAALMIGCAGGSGNASSLACLFASGPSRAAILASEEHYRACLRGRQIVRIPMETTVPKDAFCMAGGLAVDCRPIVAPFPPISRGEDSVWGLATRLCFPADRIAQAGFGLLHVPPQREGVAWSRETLAHVWRPGPAEFLVEALRTMPRAAPATRGAALHRLGAHLAALGGYSSRQFRDALYPPALASVSATLAAVEHLVEEHRARPAFWARDCQALARGLQAVKSGRRPLLPTEDAMAEVQHVFRRYGELLVHWPDLWLHAPSLFEPGSAGEQ